MPIRRWLRILLGVLFISATSVSVHAQVPPGLEPCYASDAARYQCYLARIANRIAEAKERRALMEAAIEQRRQAQLEATPDPNLKRQRERQEIQQIVEAARQRNVSHAGERYSLTYGMIPAPPDANTWLGKRNSGGN
ncbi:MAG: hypothetical protein VX610_04810 [SAR324 cluster bacterium]|nr:hypothetical protein [SAR324 cluster bacterium]